MTELAPEQRIERALALGDASLARSLAQAWIRDGGGARAHVAHGQALALAVERTAARRAFATALDHPRIDAASRALAYDGLGRIARADGDIAGAAAHAVAAVAATIELARSSHEPSIEELLRWEQRLDAAIALGRTDDLRELVAAAVDASSVTWLAWRAVALAVIGDVADFLVVDESYVIRAAYSLAALRRWQASNGMRSRRASREASAIDALAAWCDAAEVDPALPAVMRARGWALLANVASDAGGQDALALRAMRAGLAAAPNQPLIAAAAVERTLMLGDRAAALTIVVAALRLDAAMPALWRAAAQIVAASDDDVGAIAQILDAAAPGAGQQAEMTQRLLAAANDVLRDQLLGGIAGHGHRIKNRLGVIGARARATRRQAEGLASVEPLLPALRELERDTTALYETWAHYLRSMQPPPPSVDWVDFAACVASAVEAVRTTSAVAIVVENDGTAPPLRGDRVLLTDALQNLIGNGAEACVEGGEVRVSIRTAGAWLECSVTDSGSGMSPAILARVLAPGFTTKETGSGVGLTSADRVVAAHNGRLFITSEEGKGTTVTIALPWDAVPFARDPVG